MASFKVFWQKIVNKIKLPGWLTWQSFLVILVIVLFVVVMIWSEPLAKIISPRATATSSIIRITPTVKPGTPTPIPEELLESDTQTNGIILGAVILVLIVVIGAVSRMIFHGRNRKSSIK
jgi:hypothetical protein